MNSQADSPTHRLSPISATEHGLNANRIETIIGAMFTTMYTIVHTSARSAQGWGIHRNDPSVSGETNIIAVGQP